MPADSHHLLRALECFEHAHLVAHDFREYWLTESWDALFEAAEAGELT